MGKLEKNIYKITWPILVEGLFFMLFGAVDTIMLSRYSDSAIGSVGVSSQLLFLFIVMLNVVAIGIGVVASQYLGSNNIKAAKDTIVTGIVGNTILGFALALFIFFFSKTLLTLIDIDPVFFEDANTYLKIVGLSVLFIAIRVSFSTGFRSFSKPKLVMYIMILGNIVNVVINALLIYGMFGLPRMGVAGAAIGTLVSRIVVVSVMGIAVYKVLDIKLHKVRLHMEHLRKILFIGIPSALEQMLWSFAQVIIVYFLNQISEEAVIARTYIYTILRLIFIFSFSVANGNAIIVGYYIGEEEKEQAFRQTLKSLYLAFASVVVMTLLLNIFGYQVISIFTEDEQIRQMAVSVLKFAVFIEIGRAMNMVYIQALRTAGDTIFPVIMAVISMYGIAVLFSYIFTIRLEMGIIGVFLASMIDELFRGLFMAYRWYKRKWFNINLIDKGAFDS